MITLKNIIINNFCSFLGEHKLDFPERGLLSLSGQYLNMPGRSNGAGKSSVLKAVSYIFDFCDLGSDSLQNWNTKEPFSVELNLSFNGEEVNIFRNKITYVLKCRGKTYRAQAVKEFISKNILHPNLISFITYRPQDSFGNFLPLKPADKMDFLVELLELDKFQSFVDNCQEKLKFIDLQLEKLKKEIDVSKIYQYSLKERIAFFDGEIESLKVALNVSESALKSLQEPEESQFYNEVELTQLKEKRNHYRNQVFAPDQDSIELITNEIEKILSQINAEEHQLKQIKEEITAKQLDNRRIVNEASALKKHIEWTKTKILEVNRATVICPQCSSEFSPGHQLNEAKKLEQELVKSEKDMARLNQLKQINDYSVALLPQVDRAMELLMAKMSLIEKNKEKEKSFNAKNIQELEKLDLQINYFNKSCFDRLENAKQNFYIRQKQLLSDIENKKNKIQELVDKKEAIDFKLTESINKDKDDKEKVSFYKEQEYFYLEAINAIGKENFIRLMTEESLALITDRINQYLGRIPNSEKITVQLSTDKETKKGSIKKVINIKIFNSGLERSYAEFSGGEKCTINLMTDTALSEIIAERTGKSFGWLFLDEATNGQDFLTKKESLHLLKQLAHNKFILAVEHSPVVDQLDGQILVTKNQQGSSFVYPQSN